MKVVFTPGLYSGNKKIDEQHISVFKKANHMITAIETGTSKEELLHQAKDFADYIVFHTADEELYMKEASYPKRYEHWKKHEIIKQKSLKMMNRLAGIDDMEELSFIVLELVVDYVLGHIKEYDLEMTEFFNIRNNMDSML